MAANSLCYAETTEVNKTQSLLQGVLARKKGMQTIMKQFDAVTEAWTINSRAKAGCDQPHLG